MSSEAQKIQNADLVDGLRQGDPAAYRELMRLYERRLFGFAFSMLRDHDASMDVVQDTFVRVFRKVHTFKGEAAFSTWLFRIARNLCIDRCRRKARVRMSEFDDGIRHDGAPVGSPTLVAAASTNSPVRENLRRELRGQMNDALESLSDGHREIIVLRELEGLSYQEMADILGIPIGTVMSRLFHARKNMQKRLNPYLNPQASGGNP